ncbi:MAG: 3-dehydroquinate synthase [Oscillospiraceae bacterium]|nr:3-dehydroquinate synthase [Oscillospiraceae bacterium]
MEKIHVGTGRSYDVYIGRGILENVGSCLKESGAGKAVLVCGENVFPLYAEKINLALEKEGFKVFDFIIEPGEASKSLETYGKLLEFLCEKELTRSDMLIALGGGVTGDLTGFAAATYQRGIGFIQIPTTLLAMVDSSVGGKTAVNLSGGKNRAGAFWQPSAVLCDPDTLRTLPEREYRSGMAEVIKYGVLGSRAFFDELAGDIPCSHEHIIGTCVKMKRDIVAEDEFDTGKRRLLNLGHSFGHAIEALSEFKMTHGEAVSAGTAIIARASAAMGYMAESEAGSIIKCLKKYGLPTETGYSKEEIERFVRMDKKLSGDTISLAVPREIGSCDIIGVPLGDIPRWLSLGGVK